jgi:hypothetical protein
MGLTAVCGLIIGDRFGTGPIEIATWIIDFLA